MLLSNVFSSNHHKNRILHIGVSWFRILCWIEKFQNTESCIAGGASHFLKGKKKEKIFNLQLCQGLRFVAHTEIQNGIKDHKGKTIIQCANMYMLEARFLDWPNKTNTNYKQQKTQIHKGEKEENMGFYLVNWLLNDGASQVPCPCPPVEGAKTDDWNEEEDEEEEEEAARPRISGFVLTRPSSPHTPTCQSSCVPSWAAHGPVKPHTWLPKAATSSSQRKTSSSRTSAETFQRSPPLSSTGMHSSSLPSPSVSTRLERLADAN